MLKMLVFILVIIPVIWLGCMEDNAKSKSKPLNPNGDSELALLMRDMFDDGMLVRQDLLNGNIPKLETDYLRIHSAKPTEAGKNESIEYELFAKAYEAAVDRFKTASNDDLAVAYQNMVETCMNCHSEVCPGPMVKIKKMYLAEEELLRLSGMKKL